MLTEKVETAKNEAIEKENRDKIKMKEVQDRLEKIEIKLTEAEVKCKNHEKVAQEQAKRTDVFKKAVGLEITAPEPASKPKTWTEILKENKQKNDDRIEEDKQSKMKTWRKQVEIKKRVKNIEKPVSRNEVVEKKVEEKEIEAEIEKAARKEALKMGDSHTHSEEDWSWDECEQDWEGTEDRRESEKRKRIERYRKKKIMEKKTATKARHMIGIGPIRRDSISHFYEATADWELSQEVGCQ